MKFSLIVIVLLSGLLNSALVLAVCSSSVTITKPDSRYINNADGTVSDIETGLTWQQCSLGLTGNLCDVGTALRLTWQAALAAANVNTGNRYDDWRLPNKNELESLIEGACYDPAINEIMFPNTVDGYYWSSSPYVGNDGRAWNVNFDAGFVRETLNRNLYYVRLVRGSQ